LPNPTIADGSEYFNTVLWAGTGATNSITGVGFAPDFVWIKQRSGTRQNNLYDTVRGATKELFSDSTEAENTLATGLTSFDSDGFTLGTGTRANESGQTFVGWNWNAGGSSATNTDGTITSTVRANPTAGFSIVSYTGNGTAGATIGHGLGVAPKMIITKPRDTQTVNGGWAVYHTSVGNTGYLLLNLTDATSTASGAWNNTSPTSSVFSVGTFQIVNTNTSPYIALCFSEVTGYSKFGSYTGNGSTNGPFVYCGFRPAFVVCKRTDTTSNWTLFDNKRLGYNVDNDRQYPNLAIADNTTDILDILSNGFKLRGTATDNNASGGTYIFMAFAENPFKYSLAR
jgi:hypothetical protein